ncbi:unnamed protein product [Rhizoctonia solani]|uniref:glucan 1,3-beta-glucosidase n=1 Tax=Rhizoctonia solani TaxID=456999 RepID=A0A8H3E620_9AGAM|nr:unnamed protein product [Rhizoctonia solani]
MGQAQATSTWDTYEPSYETTPGTYRIVHDATNKTLQINEGTQMLIIRDREDPSSGTGREQNDHWFIIRSGDAFIFKHFQSECYISGLPWLPANARPICATHYPSTWAIRVKKDSDELRCAITIPVGWNEFQSKSGYVGIGVNSGNVRLCLIPLSGKEELDHIWRLERIGDTTFEEDCAHKVREMERQLSAANDRCASSELKLQAMQQQLDTQKAELACLHNELSTQAAELKRTQIESNQQSTELKQQNEVLGKIRKLLDTKERSLSERIKGSCENNETAPEKVQGEMLRRLEVAGGEVVGDSHPYFAFADTLDSSPLAQQVTRPCTRWGARFNTTMDDYGFAAAGEWSLAFNDCGLYLNGASSGARYDGTLSTYKGPRIGSCDPWIDASEWSDAVKDNLKQFALAHMDAFQNYFFWTWKIGASSASGKVNSPLWSYSHGLENGYMPTDPREAAGTCGNTNPRAGALKPSQTSYVSQTIAAALRSSHPFPPTSLADQANAAALPTYTPTGTPVTMPAPTFTSATVSVGSGWVGGSGGWQGDYVPVEGCTYPDPWDAESASVPSQCSGRRRLVREPRVTPPPA